VKSERRRTQQRRNAEGRSTPDRASFDYTLHFERIDFRKTPDLYHVGILLVEPYKIEILPHWRFKTVAEAKKSSTRILQDVPGIPESPRLSWRRHGPQVRADGWTVSVVLGQLNQAAGRS
jgi:hypothetical protein